MVPPIEDRPTARSPAEAEAARAGELMPDAVAARLGELVHDLRNPLNSIAMNVELVMMVAADGGSEDLEEGVDALGRAVLELESRLAGLDGYVAALRGGGSRS